MAGKRDDRPVAGDLFAFLDDAPPPARPAVPSKAPAGKPGEARSPSKGESDPKPAAGPPVAGPRRVPSDAELLKGLNPEQAAAVSHGDGPLLVLSGAGSGKTRVLTRRLAWLVAHGVPEEAIVAMTFTNKAAGEMKERVAALLETERPRSFVGTFHAYGVRLLRRFGDRLGLSRRFVVFDADDQLQLVKRAMKEQDLPDKTFTPRSVQSRLSQAKNAGWGPEELPQRFGDFLGSRLAEIARHYEKGLRAAQAVDYDDLLVLSLKLLDTHPDVLSALRRSVTHLLVDEYQDTNRIQARLVKLLAGERANVFAVGDEDQSIYSWRGADVSNILDFSRDFPGSAAVRLERNYRSTASILAAASAVVAENQRRLGKTLRAERKGGERVRLVVFDEERDEARETVIGIAETRRSRPSAELAVLFRTNAQSRPFEDELVRSGLQYQLVGGTKFYERAEVKDALAYLRLATNPDDDVSFRRVVNVPARGVGAATLEALEKAATARGVSLLSATAALPESLTERARKALVEFRELVGALGQVATETERAGDVVTAVLSRTGLAALYERSDDPQDASRRENLDELLAAAREHERAADDPSVAGFLDSVTLRGEADDVDESRGIVLMTLHAAKGLEFDEVYFVGLEDGTLPHISSQEDPDQVEEERRLAYVGMTRARERLTLSYALRRMIRGEWMDREPSPFLDALPENVLSREDRTSRRGFFAAADDGEAEAGLFGRLGRGGKAFVFPDYEGESQERQARPASPARHPSGLAARGTAPPAPRESSGLAARGTAPPAPRRPFSAPVRPPMKRTPPPPSASGFRRGAKVRHPEYGTGVVLSIEGSGDQEKLTVYFDRAGRKKFVARFANLSPA